MNIMNILEGIEKLAIDILLWVIFIPKTLFKILADPDWVPGYIEREIEKKSDRFENHVSPILLFFVSSVVLFLIAAQEDINSRASWQKTMTDLQGTYGMLAALGFLSIPLLFALSTEVKRGKKITRKGIERSLYIQGYYFSPVYSSVFAYVIVFSFGYSEFLDGAAPVLMIAVLLWFLIVEIGLIARERGSGYWKAFGVLVINFFILLVAGITILSLSPGPGGIDRGGRGEAEVLEAQKLENEGMFSIYVAGYDDSTGNYRLTLTKGSGPAAAADLALEEGTPSDDRTLAYGQFASGSISEAYGSSTWAFFGSAGDTISITVEPLDDDFDVLFDLQDANGASILEQYPPDYTAGFGYVYVLLVGVAVLLGFRSFFRRSKPDEHMQETTGENDSGATA